MPEQSRCFVGTLLILMAASFCSIAQPAVAAGSAKNYIVVLAEGTVGEAISEEWMAWVIDLAREHDAGMVVLVVNSDGGSVTEAEAIINRMIEARDLRFTAVVYKAISAAAAITMACEDIYVADTATIGAAVNYLASRNGTIITLSPDVTEKMRSIWRATCRKAAEHGGHPSILAEGMIDKEFAITMNRKNGKITFGRNGKGELLKARGRILTLTAREAVNCQLARGLINSKEELTSQLASDGWKEVALKLDTDKKEKAPPQIYNELIAKADELGLTNESQTKLQQQQAAKEWDQWFRRNMQRAKRRKAALSLILLEARPPTKKIPDRFEILATPPGEENVFIVARVKRKFLDQVAEIPPADVIHLHGKIMDVVFLERKIRYNRRGDPYYSDWYCVDRPGTNEYLVILFMEYCDVGEKKKPVRRSASGNRKIEDAEIAAEKQLKLARVYISSKMPNRAYTVLKKTIKCYPNTKAAAEAKKMLKELNLEN